MVRGYLSLIFIGLVLWMIIGIWRIRTKRSRPGSALTSSMEMLFDDNRRAAIEVIVAERTGERDPEDTDGNLPDLEGSSCSAATPIGLPWPAGSGRRPRSAGGGPRHPGVSGS